jgi:glycerophosphoryl diester phosphodiesterase
MPRTRLPPRRILSRAALAGLAVAALALGACSKFDYLPDQPLQGWSPPVVLMHRGGGYDCGDGSTVPCWPNTLPAVKHGFATLDGAEVDIQVSLDGTLWLGHDNQVKDCTGATLQCFQDKTDLQIEEVAYCDGAVSCYDPSAPNCLQHYVRAEEVFAALQDYMPEKLISLDIKGQYCRELGLSEAQHMANEVDRLVRTYGMAGRVLTETSQLAFIDQLVGRGTPADTFVVSLGDVDGPLGAAARQGVAGISFKYADGSEPMDASVVAGIHDKGFRIILWTIDLVPGDPVPEHVITEAWSAAPDVIETDEPTFFDYVPTHR